MKKPKIARIFFQTTKGKTKERKRGYMTIPASIVRELESDGWKNKDTVWLGLADSTHGFMVFHDMGDYFRQLKRIQNFEKNASKTTGVRKRPAGHAEGQKRKTKKR